MRRKRRIWAISSVCAMGLSEQHISRPRYQDLAIYMQPTKKPRFDEAFCVFEQRDRTLGELASVEELSLKQKFVSSIITVLLTSSLPAFAQTDRSAEWDHYGGGQHGMQYSSLSQISRDNV